MREREGEREREGGSGEEWVAGVVRGSVLCKCEVADVWVTNHQERRVEVSSRKNVNLHHIHIYI